MCLPVAIMFNTKMKWILSQNNALPKGLKEKVSLKTITIVKETEISNQKTPSLNGFAHDA